MAKDMGPFRDSQAPDWLSGPQTDVPPEAQHPFHPPCSRHDIAEKLLSWR
jgi:hypothetical protein